MTSAPAGYVRRLGQGARQLLALHCTLAHSRAWLGLSQALGDATLIAPDMLSHGRSPDWDGHSDYFDAVTAMARDQLTAPMDIVGHSFGAMIALRLCLECPERVRSAVLIEPVFFAVARRDAPDLFNQHERDAQPVDDAFAAGDTAKAARLFNRMWGASTGPKWPDLPERTRAAMIRGIDVVPAVHGALFDDAAQMLDPARLNRAAMPVLLLAGTGSHPVIPAICEGLKTRLPSATSAMIKGAGHMLPITHPRETAALVQDFWRKSPTTGPETGRSDPLQ